MCMKDRPTDQPTDLPTQQLTNQDQPTDGQELIAYIVYINSFYTILYI